MTPEEVVSAATQREMAAKVPESVRSACETLRAAGYEAWVVGGAVRDLVLGKTPSDWDVASDALPERVLALFDRTIATGLQHGTVTAMVGRGPKRTPVEITTFRGEGAYSDSRRPDSVHFGVPLDEDLKRRDFVINAMAFDPGRQVLHDPFGGALDLQRGLIRAVGAAEERFAEDGLRVMRAVRFASTLGFALEEETEQALSTALVPLGSVAMERVRVELLKLLAGKGAVHALELAERNGVLATILPELREGGLEAACGRITRAPQDPVIRLACLLWGLDEPELDMVLRKLKMSNDERKRIVAMFRQHRAMDDVRGEPAVVRAFLSRLGRKGAPDTLALLEMEASRTGDSSLAKGVASARDELASGAALEVGELAIRGSDVMELAGGGGPIVGEMLRALLADVLQDPSRNDADALRADVVARLAEKTTSADIL